MCCVVVIKLQKNIQNCLFLTLPVAVSILAYSDALAGGITTNIHYTRNRQQTTLTVFWWGERFIFSLRVEYCQELLNAVMGLLLHTGVCFLHTVFSQHSSHSSVGRYKQNHKHKHKYNHSHNHNHKHEDKHKHKPLCTTNTLDNPILDT